MADQDSFEMEEQAENARNYKSLIMFFVGVVILGVVGFCEILYVGMLIPAFPDGLVRLVAIGGACATGISAVALLAGKLHWFSKGKQTYAAWAFIAAETIILALNVLLAVQLHNGHVADWLQFWEGFYPAAPIVAFVGWGVILFFDRDNVVRSFRREQADKQQKAEIEFDAMAHRAKMKVKHQSLKIISGYLEETMEGQPNLLALRKTADQIYDSILTDISGQHVSSRIPRSKGIVEGSVSLPQTGSINVPAQDDELPPPATEADKRHLRDLKSRPIEEDDDDSEWEKAQAAIEAKIPCAGNCGKVGVQGNWLHTRGDGNNWYCRECFAKK